MSYFDLIYNFDGTEYAYSPDLTWKHLNVYFDEECDGTYISGHATKFIDIDALLEDEDFIEWATKFFKDDAYNKYSEEKELGELDDLSDIDDYLPDDIPE